MSPLVPRFRPVPRSGGFVLVGVVVMVLALTILGLSLFSLSSYEAQFMTRSLDEQQALQFAMGGLDRARFALSAPPQRLSNVKENLPYEYVTYARAMQLQAGVLDSTSVVLGSGDDVEITVQAEYRGLTRRVRGRYIPVTQTNYYKRLMTVAGGGIRVNATVAAPPLDACGTVVLGSPLAKDSIWVNVPGTSPYLCTNPVLSNYGINSRYVDVPAVASFLSAHPPGPATGVTEVPFDEAMSIITLPGSSGDISFWYTNNLASNEFSVRKKTGPLTIRVNGIAVWLLPRGLRADGFLTIQSAGDPNAALVIIARDGHDFDFNDYGAIWPFAGFLASIPVIFVTDGSVKLEDFNQPLAASLAPNISVFANHVLLTGPTVASTNSMVLTYGASRMDPLIDQLMAAGALPNAVTNTPYALRPGTWQILP